MKCLASVLFHALSLPLSFASYLIHPGNPSQSVPQKQKEKKEKNKTMIIKKKEKKKNEK